MEVFESLEVAYYKIDADQNHEIEIILSSHMEEMEMIIDTRPRYPSNKLTFTVANITKGTNIHFIDINLNSSVKFDVDVLLEDSKRNFLNSFVCFFVYSTLA